MKRGYLKLATLSLGFGATASLAILSAFALSTFDPSELVISRMSERAFVMAQVFVVGLLGLFASFVALISDR